MVDRRQFIHHVAVFAATGIVAACSKATDKPTFRNTDVTGADFGRSLALTDHNGRPRTLADWRGKLIVLFFGFTNCPDVCPTTLAEMAAAMQALGPQASEVQVLFVTVDPQRDTPAVLAKYVANFDQRFLALFGDEAATAAATREFKVFYQKVPGTTEGSYTIDHTAATYVLDRQGKLRLFVKQRGDPEPLVADLKTLLASR
jgi:protein SCO1